MDFSTRREEYMLQGFEDSRAQLCDILSRMQQYEDILDRGESLTRHMGDRPDTYDSVTEERIRKIFHNRSPRLVDRHGENQAGTTVHWIDIVREVKADQLESRGQDMYQCLVRGVLVEISEWEREVILETLPHFIEHSPQEQDIETEKERALAAFEDWIELHNVAVQGKSKLVFWGSDRIINVTSC